MRVRGGEFHDSSPLFLFANKRRNMRERRANNMPKQLNIDLRFNADTSQAKKQIQDLQTSLTNLSSKTNLGVNFSGTNAELQKVLQNVAQLKTQLQEATNVKTGNLDLTKFTAQLQKSGMTLEKYRMSLTSLGPDGAKAFVQLANSIAAADIPIRRTNALLAEMGTVLKNTIRWQLSSSMIHGFMGAIQQAYGYAQDLNESLTNIRIVTGQSTDQMAAFADKANKAAQALSTTTTAYTDAALIFYQQGLSDSEVEERTNAVIKMSQATGDAATEVSSYMTAVWNNFDNGSESLEHYADVITALGAATASSSSEIAQGLEKFASIADTVGLSYEYATTALATVVAQTRQSADVVGTAFKTMFARFQDLELGKTLEDGTDLGQYSKALAKVGVDIKDANGELRDMDDILDDLGAKWATLADDEKVALAQNVAGQRQYAQLVALMDNWDTFQENLITANSAEGTLQEQADTYAESWEAAQKRVRASMEAIYSSLLKDDFFIKFNNDLADILKSVNGLIKGFGGLKGVIATVGTVLLQSFNKQIISSMQEAALSLSTLTSAGRDKIKAQRTEALDQAATGLESLGENTATVAAYDKRIEAQRIYLQGVDQLNEKEMATAKFLLEQVDIRGREIEQNEQLLRQMENETDILISQQEIERDIMVAKVADSELDVDTQALRVNEIESMKEVLNYYRTISQQVTELRGAATGKEVLDFQNMLEGFEKGKISIEKMQTAIEVFGTRTGKTEEQIKQMINALNSGNIDKVKQEFEELFDATTELDAATTSLQHTYVAGYGSQEKGIEESNKVIDQCGKEAEARRKVTESTIGQNNAYKAVEKTMEESQGKQVSWAGTIVSTAGAISSFAMAINSLKGMFDVLNDESLSTSEKMLSIITTLSMVIPMVINSVIRMKDALALENIAKLLNVELTKGMTSAEIRQLIIEKLLTKEHIKQTAILLAKAAAIAALVAAIYIFVKAYEGMIDAYNKEAREAEKAHQAAEALAEAYRNAASEYEKFKNTVSNYKSAKDAMDKLVAGTEEYEEALQKANDAALELIQSGKIMASDYHWENGIMVINDEAIENAQNTIQQSVLSAEAASLMGASNASIADARSNEVNIRRMNNTEWYQSDYAAAAGAVAHDVVNAMFGGASFGLSTTNHSLISSGEDYFNQAMSGEWAEEAELERLAEVYKTLGESAVYSSDLYRNATEEMQKAIMDYCEQVAVGTSQTEAYAQQIAHANLANEGYIDEVINFSAGRYAQKVSEIRQQTAQIFDENVTSADVDISDEDIQNLFRRYREAAGLGATTTLNSISQDENGQLNFTYYDAQHELITLSKDQIANTIAASEAMEVLGNSAEEAATFLSGISDQNSRDLITAIMGNTNSEGRVNFTAEAGNFISTNGETFDYEELVHVLNANSSEVLSQEQLETAGTQGHNIASIIEGLDTELLQEYAEQNNLDYYYVLSDVLKGAAESANNFSNYLDTLSSSQQDFYENNNNFAGIVNTDQRTLLEAFSSAELNGVESQFGEIVSRLNPDELKQFAQILEDTDFSKIIPEQFISTLQQAGIDTALFESTVRDYCNGMREYTAATVQATAEFYNSLQKIAEGLTDVNDAISPEDYAKLPENMQHFFAQALDGSYRLLTSQREFNEAIQEARYTQAESDRQSIYDDYSKVIEKIPEDLARVYELQGSSETVVGETAGIGGRLSNDDYDAFREKIDIIQQITSDYDEFLDSIERGYEQDSETVARVDQLYNDVTDATGILGKIMEQESELAGQFYASDLAIALSYDNLTDLQEARDSGRVVSNEAYNMAAYQIDQAQDTAMLDPEEWEQYSDYVQEAASAIADFNDNMNDMEADIVAKSIMKMNQAIDLLANNFTEWNDVLAESNESSAEYADAMINTRRAVAMLLDTSEDYVSSDFISNHLDDIAEAATGSETAIENLRSELSQDIIANIIAENHIYDQDLRAELEGLSADLPNIEVGATLTAGNFLATLNDLVAQTGMSVDQINALCDSMGFEATFVTEPQPVTRTGHEVLTTTYVTGYQKFPGVNGDTQEVPILATRTDSGAAYSYTDYVDAIAMSTDGSTPQIESITRKPSAAHSNYSSSNGGGKSPGKSSGGGGGKTSQKKPKDPTGEIERYHVINNQIEDNEKALDRLSKAKDRAYGRARLNAMDAEIAKQRESVELAEKKLQEVEEYLKLDSGAIAAFGAEFDTNGTIVNYDQLMQEQIDKYNAAVEVYNNSAMDENAEAVFQQAEDDYNAFTEALKQYEETQDLWYEQAQAVADAKAEVLQLELEKTNYKVEIGIEWEDEDIARLDFMLKRIEDDAHKAAEAIGLLGERTVDAMDKYNVYQQGFADTLRNLGVGNAEDVIARASAGEDLYGMIGGIVDPNEMAQAVDQMDDYISNMMSSLEDAQDNVDQAFEKVKDLFNENVKQMDTYIEKIEFCQKITKSYMNIVDIVGKKSLSITNEMLRTFNAESVTQAVNNEAAAKAKMDSIQAQLLESQARLAQASGELEQKYWNEIIEEQEKELISATENFHQAWEDALQANLEAFENNIELVIEDFSNAVGDLNAMKAEWDLQKSLTDMWEPEYERWHQLSDLINDINKSVDENENLKYKQDLLDLETEIEQLQEQEAKLSEYDLNYLRLRYESKLAEIALEEAQAAKSQVRMSRDNEGNYSYVYTADEEAVNNAADDYRNKIYEMEKANEEYIDTLQQQLLEMHDKMLEDIQQAGELYGVGTQAYYDAVARIQETYVGQSEFIQLQMQNVFTNNQRLRDEDIVQYVAYTGDIAAENVDLQTSFGDTYMGIQTQTDDLQTYFNDTWLPALNETFDNVILKAEEYSQQNEVAMETAGTTMDGFRDRASQDILEVTERTTELTEETQNYGETAVDQFAKAAQAWQKGPGALLDSINTQAQAIANLAQQYTSLKSQMDAAAEAARQFAAAQAQARTSSSISYSPSSGGGGGGSSSGGGPSTYSSPSPSGGNAGIYQAISQLENGPHNSSTRDQLIALYNQIGRPESQWVAWARPGAKFDTGGYTGEWGDDGRLAVLHQKELVLNAKDTSNILTAVDVVRQLASSIDFNTMTASLATANIKSASGNSGTLEQRVEITANFPNATDRNEIEQAFQNIVNMASQYAQRKND